MLKIHKLIPLWLVGAALFTTSCSLASSPSYKIQQAIVNDTEAEEETKHYPVYVLVIRCELKIDGKMYISQNEPPHKKYYEAWIRQQGKCIKDKLLYHILAPSYESVWKKEHPDEPYKILPELEDCNYACENCGPACFSVYSLKGVKTSEALSINNNIYMEQKFMESQK